MLYINTYISAGLLVTVPVFSICISAHSATELCCLVILLIWGLIFFFSSWKKKYLWDSFEAKHKNPFSPREPVLSCREPKCLLNKAHGLAGFSHLCSIQLACKYTSWRTPSLFCNFPSLAKRVDRLGLLLCIPLIKDVTLDGLRFT